MNETAGIDKQINTSPAILIGIVVGEASGDQLGVGLMQAIKRRLSNVQFIGIGGPKMIAEGFETLADMERLSVMGLVEPLRRLPELFSIRNRLKRYFLTHRPAIVIGIDAPDFNLGLERALKAQGIKTCHYVCPSVWAWRQGRLNKIKQSADHVLALLPFEADFLKEHGIAATFVGHPLAERLCGTSVDRALTDPLLARRELLGGSIESCIDSVKGPIICVMPGSRRSEVEALFEVFLASCLVCLEREPSLKIVIPAATLALYEMLMARLSGADIAPVRSRIILVEGNSLLCMKAADVVLLASGTATLEAALLGTPMVVAYRLSWLTFAIVSRMVKVKYVALPNLLTDVPQVPEFLQQDATPEKLSAALLSYLNDHKLRTNVIEAFTQLQTMLAQNADEKAAEVILGLCH